MMRKIFFYFLLINTAICNSQRFNTLNDDKPFIDSIQAIIKTSKTDSVKAINSFKLADLFRRNGNYNKFYEFLRVGKKYSFGNAYLKEASKYYEAQNFLISKDIQSYKKNIEATLQKIKKFNIKESYELQVVILQNLSIISRIQEDEKESLRILLEEATPMAKKSQNRELIGEVKKHIGIALMNNSEREKAYDYFKESIDDLLHASRKSPIIKESIVEIYVIAAENCVYMNKVAEGRFYLKEAFTILKDYPNSNLNNIYYFSEGLCFFMQKQYKEALRSLNIGINSSFIHSDLQSLNRLKFVKYQTLFELKRYKDANDLLIDLVENGNLFVEDKKNYFKEIAMTFEKMQDFKSAYQFSQKYMRLNDSLVESETKKEILRLETKFNNVEKTKKIISLEKEKNEAYLKAKNNRLYYLTFALISIILLSVVFFLWKFLKNQKQSAKQNAINYIQNLKVLQKEKEIQIMQAINDSEEAERKRIARDLHDGIGSRLSSLKMQLNHVMDKGIVKSEVEKINSELSISISELRKTAYNLMPEALLKLGLEHALKDLCISMATDRVKIFFNAFEIQKNIKEANQINIYRIVQELLANSLKHSNCDEIHLDCSQNDTLFLINLEDNGMGFDTNNADTLTGLGLKNIKNRVELLNGKYEVKSSRSGTIFYIELTVQNNNKNE